MRKVLRNKGANTYWDDRWAGYEKDEASFTNLSIYPVRFVEAVIRPEHKVLDAGCGLGRIVKHYANQGIDIEGCDYSQVAVDKLHQQDASLRIKQADISQLPYRDESFDLVLAFGVLHSIEDPDVIQRAISEVKRCLVPGGVFVASARADTLENKLIDKDAEKKGKAGNEFHKWCFTKKEFKSFFTRAGLLVERLELVTNYPYLHKHPVFRRKKGFDEKESRARGYELNMLGRITQSVAGTVLPGAVGTTYVVTSRKD